MLNKIFSVRNSDDKLHKIITVLGIKISILVRKKMKLGIAYNIFDGEELLEASLKSVRDAADYICVVYQLKSYYGENAAPNLQMLLNDLKNKGLIDEIYLYEKDFSKHNNNKKIFEREKRDIGLNLCKKANCTHFMSMDVDEFYDSEQINYTKNFIINNNINSSACSIYEYLKYPEYRLVNDYTFTTQKLYNFYVPFIMKIHKYAQRHGDTFQTYADPTRALNGDEKFYLFPVQDVVMHHMCTIRKDLDKKYNNSTFIDGGKKYIDKISEIKQDVLNWQPENYRIGNTEYYLFNDKILEKVENKFNINIDNEN